MNLNDYQTGAIATAIYPDTAAVVYPAMLLGAEAGETLNKIQKHLRKGNDLQALTDEEIDAITDEVGDVLWACAALMFDLNRSLEHAATRNLKKLQSRAERGVLEGNGDNR